MQKYNGQLIRQFASSVSGNAASGVTVTVRRQSDAGLATLYVDNNIAGATLSNPITTTSTGHFAFYAPDDVYTLTFSDSTPAQVIQLQDVGELQEQFDAAVLNAGYIPSGTFAAGATLTQANQVLSDGSSYWRWDGSFPKAVTAGSAPTPVGVGQWFLISDFALRGELEEVDSTVLIGGVEAGEMSKAYYSSFINKSLLVALRKKGNSVITGDSLSYNHQDLDATSRATAEACASGMRSWSFMLRDIIKKQDPFFKYLDEIEIGNATVNPSSVVSYNAATTAQIMPHGGRLTTLTALPSEAEIFSFNYKHQGAESLAYLLLVGDPTGFGCTYSVSVDGGSVVNSTTVLAQSGINTFQGRRIVLLPIAVPNDGQNHIIRLYNFVQAAAVPDASGLCKLNIIGMSAVSNPVILTGVGGFSTTQLLTQWSSRVTTFAPNALICIIGANDSYQGIPISTFKTNLQTMIDSTRTSNASCEILFMSTPGSASGSEFSVPDATALQYVRAMREVCTANKCSFFNTFEFAKQPLQSNMLFDWVHFNRSGNRALCAELCDLLGLTYQYSDIDTDYSLINGSRVTVNLKYNGATFIASPAGTGTNPKVYGIATTQGASGLIQSAISTDGETVRLTLREPIASFGGIAINKRGFSAVRLTPIITAYGTNYVDFKIVKNDGTSLVQHADYPTLVNDLSFNVTY